MIYRKNSACRRASAATFFSPVLSLVAARCTTRYNCRNIFGAEGVADSQFNFMAYTVPPFAAAYLYVRHLLSSFYIYSPPFVLPPPFKKLFYSASSKLSNHFPVFLELFKNLSTPPPPPPLLFYLFGRTYLFDPFVRLLSPFRNCTFDSIWEMTRRRNTGERLICNWNAKKSRGLSRLLVLRWRDETKGDWLKSKSLSNGSN